MTLLLLILIWFHNILIWKKISFMNFNSQNYLKIFLLRKNYISDCKEEKIRFYDPKKGKFRAIHRKYIINSFWLPLDRDLNNTLLSQPFFGSTFFSFIVPKKYCLADHNLLNTMWSELKKAVMDRVDETCKNWLSFNVPIRLKRLKNL